MADKKAKHSPQEVVSATSANTLSPQKTTTAVRPKQRSGNKKVAKPVVQRIRSASSTSSSNNDSDSSDSEDKTTNVKKLSGDQPALQLILEKLEHLEACYHSSSVTRPSAQAPAAPAPTPVKPPSLPLRSQVLSADGGVAVENKFELKGGDNTGDWQGGDPVRRWKGTVTDGEFANFSMPAFPMVVRRPSLNWKMLKEIKQAITTYGLKSGYTTALTDNLFSVQLLTPYDIRVIVHTLLTPHQQVQFFDMWQAACNAAEAVPRQPGDPLCGVTAQQLMGLGPFASLDWQARFPVEVLQLTQNLAIRAWSGIQDDQAGPAFATIRQGPTEPYGSFVRRLHTALAANTDMDGVTKTKMLDTLAFDNANVKTKQILSTLPRGARTAEMLQVAERINQEQMASYVATTVKAVVKILVQRTERGKNLNRKCYNCGKFGHFRANCRTVVQTQRWCFHCQTTHSTQESHNQGNQSRSANAPRAMTPNQGASTAAPQPPLAVLKWTWQQQ
ncbi:endogenous retrovirus group K member 24 Gag polyprotein-like [Melanerpes formicivorus]|uniref:endogenous retrovirus group K member 24 Gag polyprotein-like n=1 Tax=Melanerpes formicivorus TaxID=211600 RepID=UPI00358ECAB2